jgi:hypothetical protein
MPVRSRSARDLVHAGVLGGWLALWSACVLVGCGPTLDAHDQGTSGEGAGSSSTTMTTITEVSTTNPAEDASRFLGVFHYDHQDFGDWVWCDADVAPRWPPLINVEIRPDGTAGMFMQECVPLFGDHPLEVEWRWELVQDEWLELRPGPGEASLRFIEPNELASLRATIDDQCTMRFEADGEPLLPYVFRRGRACWWNRCEPSWTMYIDYCEGEEPPPCP